MKIKFYEISEIQCTECQNCSLQSPATWCVECFSDLTVTTSIDIWWMQSQKFQENWFAFSNNSFYSQHHKKLVLRMLRCIGKMGLQMSPRPSTQARAGWRWGRSCSASASCSSRRWPWGPASTAGPRARSYTPSSSQPGHIKIFRTGLQIIDN